MVRLSGSANYSLLPNIFKAVIIVDSMIGLLPNKKSMKTYNAKYYNISLRDIAIEWKLLLLDALAAVPAQCDS